MLTRSACPLCRVSCERAIRRLTTRCSTSVSAMPQRTSMTECCFKKTVDRQMSAASTPQPPTTSERRCQIRLRRTARKMATVVETWMDGQTLVEVSTAQTICIRLAAMLSPAIVSGRSCTPLGNSRYSSRLMAMPENMTAHR